jgi:RNA polymerase sigma-70 factor, ECF subfamily
MSMPQPQVDDMTLVERVRAGDSAAFQELVSRYENKVYRLAIKLTRNEALAEEVLQEVFIKIFEKLDTFRGESALSSWIYRIAANAAFSKLNLEKRHQHADLDDAMPQAEASLHERTDTAQASPDRPLLSEEAVGVISRAIERLPEDFRVVITLRDVEGLPNEEVARILELSVPAVKSRLHRARLLLRKRLAKYFDRQDIPY